MTETFTVPTSEEIVAAFRASGRFPEGSPQLEIFSSLVSDLVEIIGEDRLSNMVGLRSLCEVRAEFVEWLVGNAAFTCHLGMGALLAGVLYGDVITQHENIVRYPDAWLVREGVEKEDEAMMDRMGLNEAAQVLYQAGELTFAKLLGTSPGACIPDMKTSW